MSTKFEKLLDYLVNEEMDKANELFHEIVVEKSREIYENLIAEEAEDDEEMDEGREEDDEEMDEGMKCADDEEMDEGREEDDEEMDEGREELEDSYSMEADDDAADVADPADKFGADIGATSDDDTDMGDEFGADGMDDEESAEDQAIFDIKNAIDELEAAFAELQAAQGDEEGADEFDDEEDADFDDEEGDEFSDDEDADEMMGSEMYEGKKRLTREYVEKVGNDWEQSGTQKTQGQYAGAGTGKTEGKPLEGRSTVNTNAKSSMPNSKANAKNLVQKGEEGQHNTGTSPNKVNKGVVRDSGEKFTGSDVHNVGTTKGFKKSGVGTLTNVKGGHGAEKKGGSPEPVGAGRGDKAGQTSIAPETKKQFLKPYKK